MPKQLIFISLLFIIASGFSYYVLTNHNQHNDQPNNQQLAKPEDVNPVNQLIFFYGDNCPHCHVVDDYISDNKINQQLNIINKEVYNNQKNAEELRSIAKQCGIPLNALGVPLLWSGQDCLVGDQPIINFLNDQINK